MAISKMQDSALESAGLRARTGATPIDTVRPLTVTTSLMPATYGAG